MEESKQTILLVDDVAANLDFLVGVLKDKYAIKCATNGKEAIMLMKRHPPDLVLLDIMMPEMDGTEVLRIIKNHEVWRHIPVVMISAIDKFETVAQCIEKGAEDYLIKPFNATLLLVRIKACLKKKSLHDQEVKLREKLEKNLKQLKESESSIDGLTNIIVKEMNFPLLSLLEFLHITKKAIDAGNIDEKMLKKQVYSMTKSVEHLMILVHGVMDLSKKKSN